MNIRFRNRERGAALVVSLLLLAILTVLAVSASQSTRLQERMAGNVRDLDLAFQAAEAGSRGAEAFIASLTSKPSTCSALPPTCNVLQPNVVPADLASTAESWWSSNAKNYGGAATQEITTVNEDPRFVLEEGMFVPDDLTVGGGPPTGRQFYRTFARGEGGTQNAVVVIQTTFTRRF